MKKTLVALAVLAAAGSVNAAEVYSNDGVTTSLSGVAEVQLIDNEGYADKDLAVRLDDFDITAATSVALSDDVAAVGAVSLGQDRDTSNVSADRVYVGFASAEMGTITFGQQTLLSDDDGIGADYEFGGVQYGTKTEDSTDVVKYVYDNGQFYTGLSYDVAESNGEQSSIDGRIGFRVDSLDVRLYAYSDETDGADETDFNLEGVYTADALAIAASIGSMDVSDVQTDVAEINVKYTVEATTYALGYSYAKADNDGAKSVDTVYANVTQKLAPSVKVYAEAGYQADAVEEFGYVTGMEVSF
jgi:predicted porin